MYVSIGMEQKASAKTGKKCYEIVQNCLNIKKFFHVAFLKHVYLCQGLNFELNQTLLVMEIFLSFLSDRKIRLVSVSVQ